MPYYLVTIELESNDPVGLWDEIEELVRTKHPEVETVDVRASLTYENDD